eukprot:g2478.t1
MGENLITKMSRNALLEAVTRGRGTATARPRVREVLRTLDAVCKLNFLHAEKAIMQVPGYTWQEAAAESAQENGIMPYILSRRYNMQKARGSDVRSSKYSVDELLWAARRAGFSTVTAEDEAYANDHHFRVSNPVKIHWDFFEKDAMQFTKVSGRQSHDESYLMTERGQLVELPTFSNRVLMLKRGAGLTRREGYMYLEKMDEMARRFALWTYNRARTGIKQRQEHLSAVVSQNLENYKQQLVRIGGTPALEKEKEKEKKEEKEETIAVNAREERQGDMVQSLSHIPFSFRTLLGRVSVADMTFEDILVVFKEDAGSNPSKQTRKSAIGTLQVRRFRHVPISELELLLPSACQEVSMRPMDRINFTLAAIGCIGVCGAALTKGMQMTSTGIFAAAGVITYVSRVIFRYRLNKAYYASAIGQHLHSNLCASNGEAVASIMREARILHQDAIAIVCSCIWLHEEGDHAREITLDLTDILERCEALRIELRMSGSTHQWEERFQSAVRWLQVHGVLQDCAEREDAFITQTINVVHEGRQRLLHHSIDEAKSLNSLGWA